MSELSKKIMIEKINKLKKEKNAIILAHHYEVLDVQHVADFLGDSLQLAKEATKTDADIVVFCGVKFMAETAKMLNPDAKVLLSSKNAGCPLADKISSEQLDDFKAQYPDAKVVCYINSSIETKAKSDVCCTSSNAVQIVESYPKDQKILFVPDRNLGTYAKMKTNRDIVVWDGYCYVHDQAISLDDVKKAKEKCPNCYLLVHPECKPEVFEKADLVSSTKGIIDFTKMHDNVIIGTEIGVYEELKEMYPNKNIIPLSNKAVCQNMKKTSLKDVLVTLLEERNEMTLDKDIAKKALKSVNKMMELS